PGVRPPRGPCGDDQTPSRRHQTPDGSRHGWNTAVAGYRDYAGWRRLLHADARGFVARGDPRRGRLFLSQRAGTRARGRDEHTAERRVPWLWGAAIALCR